MVPWIVAAVAVIVVVVLMAALLLRGTDIAIPTYHGTISVRVHNDAWFDRVSCSVYIDNNIVKDDSVGPLGTENWTFSVKWTGESIHEFQVKVVSSTNTQTATIYLKDGESKTATITI
jgi:archaellum component FlaG (FlaF/FlaG flagellin family)